MTEHAVDHIGRLAKVSVESLHGSTLFELATQEAKGQLGGAQRISQLMRDEAQVFRGLPLELEIAMFHVLEDRVGDPGVQESRDHLLIAQADDQLRLAGDLKDAFVKRAVLADDLGDVEAQTQTLLSVLLRVGARGRQRDGVRIERADDFIDEGRHVIEKLGAQHRHRDRAAA
ncbi:MAG TPA: hypothetical protein VHG72_19195 [Polyangia bacterium]|nr:hypothetical protein [Polyangia bacterium]